MRKLLGARLCDRPSCPERWPCPTHGTRRVGDYEHLGKHAGQFAMTGVPDADGDMVLDIESCKTCGVALCVCPVAVPVVDEAPRCDVCGSTDGEMRRLALSGGWSCANILACAGRCVIAMRASDARELSGASKLRYRRGPAGEAILVHLRPGWTADSETYYAYGARGLVSRCGGILCLGWGFGAHRRTRDGDEYLNVSCNQPGAQRTREEAMLLVEAFTR